MSLSALGPTRESADGLEVFEGARSEIVEAVDGRADGRAARRVFYGGREPGVQGELRRGGGAHCLRHLVFLAVMRRSRVVYKSIVQKRRERSYCVYVVLVISGSESSEIELGSCPPEGDRRLLKREPKASHNKLTQNNT